MKIRVREININLLKLIERCKINPNIWDQITLKTILLILNCLFNGSPIYRVETIIQFFNEKEVIEKLI